MTLNRAVRCRRISVCGEIHDNAVRMPENRRKKK